MATPAIACHPPCTICGKGIDTPDPDEIADALAGDYGMPTEAMRAIVVDAIAALPSTASAADVAEHVQRGM